MQQTENFGLTIYEPNDVTSYLTSSGWNGTMTKLDSIIKSIQTEGVKNGSDIAALELQTSNLNKNIETINDDVNTLKNATSGNTSNINGLNNRVIAVEKEVETLSEKVGKENWYTGVLSAGETTLAIEIGTFTDVTLVDVYSSIYGVDPVSVELRTP